MKLDKKELADRNRLQLDYFPVALKEGKLHSIFHRSKTSKLLWPGTQVQKCTCLIPFAPPEVKLESHSTLVIRGHCYFVTIAIIVLGWKFTMRAC